MEIAHRIRSGRPNPPRNLAVRDTVRQNHTMCGRLMNLLASVGILVSQANFSAAAESGDFDKVVAPVFQKYYLGT